MATFNVSTSAQLKTALSQASGGDTIRLAPGNYGAVEISKQNYKSPVTITSANSSNEATITKLTVRNSENIRFHDIDFKVSGGGGGRPFSVDQSSKITFTDAKFEGTMSGGYAVGMGLTVTNSRQITVDNSEFLKFHRGAEFRKVTDLKVVNSEVHQVAGDGMVFAQIQGGLIQGNDMHSMRGDPKSNYHKDMIQFWTTSTDAPTRDVVIRGNRIDTDDGSTQSIFFGNSMAKSNKNFYWQNLTIENNTIVAGHRHGIYVEEANGLTIRNNVVVQDTDTNFARQIHTPIIEVTKSSQKVTITGNTAHDISGGSGSGWTISNNKFVSKGYKISDGDKGVIKAPSAPAPAPAPEKEVAEKAPAPAPAPAPEKPAATPPSSSGTDLGSVSIADITKPQSQAFYSALARDMGLELRTNGQGGSKDALVLASNGIASAGQGDNLLVGRGGGGDSFLGGVGENLMVGLAGADTFRFTGSHVRKDKTDVILDANFAQRDEIVFRSYERGTFEGKGGGNRLDIWDNGSSVVIDSAVDLREMVAFSSGVSARTSGSTLTLEIEQKSGTHQIELAGLAQAYLAVDSALF